MPQIILLLEKEYIEEVFEILCDLPFEHATAYDIELPTKRHPGIEQLINQLEARLIEYCNQEV